MSTIIKTPYIAYLLTGGNIGNRVHHLTKAKKLIEKYCGNIIASSAYYETAAWGVTNQPNFYNQVLALNTQLLPIELMKTLLQIESMMGRVRNIKMGPRIIDIDILIIENFICNDPILQLPHPALIERRFALTPLAEVAPNLIHPVEKKNILQLLHDCTDNLNVQKI
jgi:2-amino-4-hydroxy-6-hydroxymethyldihydropteridine diphosphokinase